MTLVSERLAFLISADGSQAIRAFEQTGRAAERELGKAEDRIDRVGGQMTRFGAGALAASGIAAGGLFSLATSAAEVNAAFAANEQVLGDSSDAIQEWAKNSVESAGLSERAAIEATTSFGSLAKSAGLAGQDVANFSTDLVELAADLAAFKDVSPEQVLQDLQSGFAGSTEVLRKYNIFLDDASLKAALFRETGEQVTGTLTTQQKIIAINSELYRQSADAQGQWARESDGLVAQQAQLKAELENLQAAIGQGVLPVVNGLVSGLNDAAGAFNELDPSVQSGIGTFATYGTAAAGITGALSLAGGQAIKFRDNLTTLQADGTRSLNRLGRAAKGAGVAFGAFLAFDLASESLTRFSGRADLAEDNIRGLLAAINNGMPETDNVLDEFLTTADNFDKFGGGGPIGFLDRLFESTVQVNGTRASLDQYRDSLEQVFDQDPAAAAFVVESLRQQRDAAAEAGENIDGYSQVIDELNPLLDEMANAMGTTQDELLDQVGALSKASGEVDKFESATDRAARKLGDFEEAMADLRGEVDGDNAYLDLIEDVERLREATEEATEATVTGSEDADQAVRDQQRATNALKEELIDYATEVGNVPESRVTDIIALIDAGKLEEAAAQIETLTAERNLVINPVLRGSIGRFDNNGNYIPPGVSGVAGPRADGGQVRAGETYWVGEEGPELFRAPGTGTIYPNGSQFGADNGVAALAEQISSLATAVAARPASQLVINSTGYSRPADLLADSYEAQRYDDALHGRFSFAGDRDL